MICIYCGKDFTELPSKYASGKFCSRTCAMKYASQFGNTASKKKQKSDKLKESSKLLNFAISKQIEELSSIYNFHDIAAKLDMTCKRVRHIANTYNIKENEIFVPATWHAATAFCKNVLKKDTSITYADYDTVRNIIEHHLHIDNMTPDDICKFYNCSKSHNASFLANCFHVKLKSISDALFAYYDKQGYHDNISCKIAYWKECRFRFSITDYPNIKGYDLISKYGLYNPYTNQNGIVRDHMISIYYGWKNNISPEIISHPANCEYMMHSTNSSKKEKCSLTLDELLCRIASFHRKNKTHFDYERVQ